MAANSTPNIIPESFEELDKILNLGNRTIKHLRKKYPTPREAILAVRALELKRPLPHDMNDSTLSLYGQSLKKGFIFREYFFGKAVRKLAAKLEPHTYLSIQLPYSRLLAGETISEEAYRSLRPLTSNQIKRVLDIIKKALQNESHFEIVAQYLDLLPNTRLMKEFGKTCAPIDSRACKLTKAALEILSTQSCANAIIFEAFSPNEGDYMVQQLIEYGIPDDHSRECLDRISYRTELLRHPPAVRIPIDLLCEEQEISCAARNYLYYCGIHYADELANLSYTDFCKMPNIGIDDRYNIICSLKSRGVIFIDERFYCE